MSALPPDPADREAEIAALAREVHSLSWCADRLINTYEAWRYGEPRQGRVEIVLAEQDADALKWLLGQLPEKTKRLEGLIDGTADP